MTEYKQIVVLDNEIEASIMEDVLKERDIPHIVQSYHVPGYDGVFQFHMGWGHIESEEKYKEEILEIYNDIKKQVRDKSDIEDDFQKEEEDEEN